MRNSGFEAHPFPITKRYKVAKVIHSGVGNVDTTFATFGHVTRKLCRGRTATHAEEQERQGRRDTARHGEEAKARRFCRTGLFVR